VEGRLPSLANGGASETRLKEEEPALESQRKSVSRGRGPVGSRIAKMGALVRSGGTGGGEVKGYLHRKK